MPIQLSKLINHSMLLGVINMDNWELEINKLVNKNYQSKLIATLRMKQFSDKSHVDTCTLLCSPIKECLLLVIIIMDNLVITPKLTHSQFLI